MRFPLEDIKTEPDCGIYAAAAHDNGKPPVLLIHGFLSSRAQWLDNLPGMMDFARPIVVEQFHHGRTGAPAEEDDAPAEFLARLEMIRTHLGLDNWFLCGHSLGGAMSLNYLLAYPERTRGVVFTNAISAFRRRDMVRTRINVDEFADQLEAEGQKALRATPFHPRFMKRISARVYERVVADSELIDPNSIARILRSGQNNVSIRERVAEVSKPTLLINGAREKGFQDDRDWAAQNLPGLRVIDFAEGGHNVNAEHPEAFNAALRDFMEEHG